MNLLLLEPEELKEGKVTLKDRRSRHLLNILHVKPGDSVRAGLLNGSLGRAVVEKVHHDEILLQFKFDNDSPPMSKVDMILAMPRPKVLRRMWASLASLGVGHVALTNAWRVERAYFDTHVLKPEVYVPLLKEGLEQGVSTLMPTVSVHKRLVKLLEDDLEGLFRSRAESKPMLLAHPRAEHRISEILLEIKPEKVLLAVGPEGGWIDREIELFQEVGFIPVNTGKTVLRTDVACHILLGMVNDLTFP